MDLDYILLIFVHQMELCVSFTLFIVHNQMNLTSKIVAKSGFLIGLYERVVKKCIFHVLSPKFLLLVQVILQSQVKASLTIHDAWLDLQDCFDHTDKGDGRPVSRFFPLIVSPKNKAGMMFSICLADTSTNGTFNIVPSAIILIPFRFNFSV